MKRNHVATIIWLIAATVCSCSDDDDRPVDCIDPSRVKTPAACPDVVEEVCGCDNKTYSNACFAESSGVLTWINGPCQ